MADSESHEPTTSTAGRRGAEPEQVPDPADPAAAPAAPGGVSVVTVIHRAHDALEALYVSLDRSERRARQLVVVALDDDSLIDYRPEGRTPVTVVPMSTTPQGLGWAGAKNAGATTALLEGATVVVFAAAGVEVEARTLGELDQAARRGGLWWAAGDGSSPTEVPGPALAISLETWGQVTGYCESYVGAGYEDADLARMVRELGLPAEPVADLAVGHRHVGEDRDPDELERNARLWRSRWADDEPPAQGGGW